MRDHEQHGAMRIAAAILVVIAIGAGAWGGISLFWPQDNGQIAQLRADSTPYKVKPDEVGGMVIPHQDKQVFNAVSSEGKVVTVERILPGPEKPIIPEPAPVIAEAAAMTQAQVAQAATAAPPAASAPNVVVEAVPAPEPAPVALGRAVDAPTNANQPAQANLALDPSAVAKTGAKAVEKADTATAAFDSGKYEPPLPQIKPEKAIDNKAAQAVEKLAEASPDEEPQEEKTSAADAEENNAEEETHVSKTENSKPTLQNAVVSSGGARFQLASFFDRPSAERAKAKFKSSYASALGGAELMIVEATISGNKKVYRIQGAAPEGDVVTLCGQIKAKGGTCVPTKH